MPANTGTIERIEKLTPEQRAAQPLHCQEHWYILASQMCQGLSVLDVGAGTGYGLPILAAGGASEVLGIDPLPAGPGVVPLDVSKIRDKSYDMVVSFDVIEHVEDDKAFLADLFRIARRTVIFSTPNWNHSKCQNKFHLREYTPEELTLLLSGKAFIAWTRGPNRVTDPIQHIASLGDAKSVFCVVSCSDLAELNGQIALRANEMATSINVRLSDISKSAEEWTEEAKLIAGGKQPLYAARDLIGWLSSKLAYSRLPSAAPGSDVADITKILRYSLAGPLQQSIVMAWALNTFVVGPKGPYINQPK